MSMKKITRLENERDRLLTEVAGSQNLSSILNLMEAKIQELKQQLAEMQEAENLMRRIRGKILDESQAEVQRLSQVNGKLVKALTEAKEFIENQQLDEPEWHSTLDACVIALAEAQKECNPE